MGTRCRIVVYGAVEAEAAAACAAAFERIAGLETVLSDYREDSEASKLVRKEPGLWHPVSVDLARTLRLALSISEASGGAFDPTLGPLTELWRASRRSGRLPRRDELGEAVLRSGYGLLEVDPQEDRVRFETPGMKLDFGGIGKGLAADEALLVLRSLGHGSALIDFGGDLVAGDAPPGEAEGWLVRVRDGVGRTRELWLVNAAVATSGDLEQFVEIDGVRYAHIVDPVTGLGLTCRVAATVIADAGWMADALASAACVLGPGKIDGLRRAFPNAVFEVALEPGSLDPG